MQSNKIIFLEYLRSICAIVVVIDHIAIAAIHLFEKEASSIDMFIYHGIQHWSHFAVPIFLMISGYLLLGTEKPINYTRTLNKYIKRMIINLMLIGSFFAYLEILFSVKAFSLNDFIKAIYFTLIGKTWDHMWYLYVLIGIYFILPILKPIFQYLEIKTLDCFLLILFIFNSILPTIKELFNFSLGIQIPISSIFLFYFLLGGRLRKSTQIKILNRPIFLLCVMLIPFVCAFLEYIKGLQYLESLSNYSSPIIVTISLSLFLNIDTYKKKFEQYWITIHGKIIKHIADNSFGIYIFHMLFINILYKVFKFNPIDFNVLILIPITIAIIIISDITTIIYRKIPIIGKYI